MLHKDMDLRYLDEPCFCFVRLKRLNGKALANIYRLVKMNTFRNDHRITLLDLSSWLSSYTLHAMLTGVCFIWCKSLPNWQTK